MDLMQFISDQLLILVAAVYVLGMFLKKIEMVRDNFIPIILMVFSIVLSMVLQGVAGESILQGVLCWGVAIGINQTGKQLVKEEK